MGSLFQMQAHLRPHFNIANGLWDDLSTAAARLPSSCAASGTSEQPGGASAGSPDGDGSGAQPQGGCVSATFAGEPVHRALGLTDDEAEAIASILGRAPNHLELAMYSVMWSEHCSYKSSRLHLRRLPTEAPWVLVGPGENAGVIDVGDGIAAAIRIESHNHPSAIEPYQGAATGVGGILRDIFTMGARPIALMDPLRFGPLDDPRSRWIAEGVVSGISGYGNAVGVPTVGGETVFDADLRRQPAGQRPLPRPPARRPARARAGLRRRQPGRPARVVDRPRRHRRGVGAGLGRVLRRRRPMRPSGPACRSAIRSRRSGSSRRASSCSPAGWWSASRTSAAPA